MWKIPLISKEQAGTCRSGGMGSQSEESCQGAGRAALGLDWLPRASPLRGHLAWFPIPRIAQRPVGWEILLVSVDAGNCVTAMWAPGGGEEPFPEGRTFQYPPALSLVSMEMAKRPKQEVGFLGEGRADPWVSFPPSESPAMSYGISTRCHGIPSG